MSNTDQLWALVHGQLDEQQSAQLTKALESDAALRQELEQVREVDRLLRGVAPYAEQDEETLAKKVLRAWEASPESGAWGQAAREAPAKSRTLDFPSGVRLWIQQPWRALQAVAAVAACLMAAFGLRNYYSTELDWGADRLQPAQYRGEAAASQAALSEDDLKALANDLRASIAAFYQEQAAQHPRSFFRRRTAWVLTASIQEMPDGLLSVRVEASRPRETVLAGKWADLFEDRHQWADELPGFSRKIVNELVQLDRPTATR